MEKHFDISAVKLYIFCKYIYILLFWGIGLIILYILYDILYIMYNWEHKVHLI